MASWTLPPSVAIRALKAQSARLQAEQNKLDAEASGLYDSETGDRYARARENAYRADRGEGFYNDPYENDMPDDFLD